MMNFDFQAVMILALLIAGAIWLFDAVVWAPRRREKVRGVEKKTQGSADEKELAKIAKEPLLVEYARSFFPIILVVLLLRSFLVEPFRIPSGSMLPTLLVGDFILVNKFSYGIRLPLFGVKIVDIGEPQRGDIVVFRYPKDPSIDYIKRVVGLPGDRVGYFNKTVYINGEPVAQEPMGMYTDDGAGVMMTDISERLEHLDGVDHRILIRTRQRSMNGEYVVPEGRYFVMGDNRDNSNDSRFWGTVPEENLVGKAFMIWMNWDSRQDRIIWKRIGSSLN